MYGDLTAKVVLTKTSIAFGSAVNCESFVLELLLIVHTNLKKAPTRLKHWTNVCVLLLSNVH